MRRGTQIERRQTGETIGHEAEAMTARDRPRLRAGEGARLEVRPAAWLLVAVEVLSLMLGRPTLGKRALVGLAWGLLPRRLRLLAGGAAAVALLLGAGAVAALLFVICQLA
jgi:hypothetical protein